MEDIRRPRQRISRHSGRPGHAFRRPENREQRTENRLGRSSLGGAPSATVAPTAAILSQSEGSVVAPSEIRSLSSATTGHQKLVLGHDRGSKLNVEINFQLPRWLRHIHRPILPAWLRSVRVRVALVVITLALLLTQFVPILEQHLTPHSYALGPAESLLTPKDPFLAKQLKSDPTSGDFNYNTNYSPVDQTTVDGGGGPQFKAVANRDPGKGFQITDPVSNTELDITPEFSLWDGKQDGNRLVYPLVNGTGWVVYTMGASTLKEDVILKHANGDTMKLRYKLDLQDGQLVAKLAKDGAVVVYGSSLPINGNVSTGTAKDAALLQEARQHAKKDKVLYVLPAPTVYESGKQLSKTVQAHYELKGDTLTTVTTGLKQASFPLDIDPAVTVIGTSDLFRDTNPDSNIDFNGISGNISRGAVTGGVVTTSWTANANHLNTARFLNGAAVYDDYAYVAGGAPASSTSNTTSVEYAAMSKSNQSIGSWSTTTSLPVALSRFQLIAYNGYLYAIGGSSGDTTCTTDSNAIYYNRIQTNGQLSATWTTASTTLPAALCGLGAAIYNNMLYIAGGRTSASATTASTQAAYAAVNPDGSIASFTTCASNSSGGCQLIAGRYDMDLKIYNGYAYEIGGLSSSGSPVGTVAYIPIASDGSLYSTWTNTTTMVTARSAMGATLAAANDGYMYIQGGCSAFNANQSCTTIASDIEIAQINANGTLGNWSNVSTSVASYSQVGGNLIFWRGTIYVFAGCSSMSTTAIQCTTALNTPQYDSIATAGQVGPVKTGTGPIALFAAGVAVFGGFIYVVGGCLKVACQTSGTGNTSSNVYYAELNPDGSIGSWTTDSHTIPTTNGLAAMGIVVYNDYMYVIGGYNYTNPVSTIYYAPLKWPSNGSQTGGLSGNFTATTSLAANNTYMSAFAFNNNLYVIGGCTAASHSIGCSSYTATNYKFPINSDGTLGTITTTGIAALPVGKAIMASAFYNGYIYLAGGATSANAQTNNVYYAQVSQSGTIASWSTTTGTLPHTIRRAAASVTNGYLYVFGGHDASVPTTYPYIFIGKITMSSGDIASFSQSVVTITARWDLGAVFSNGYLYTVEGCSAGSPPASCTTISNTIEYVEVYNAGNKNSPTWTAGFGIGTGRFRTATVAYNGYLYVIGGCNNTGSDSSGCTSGAYVSTVNVAPIHPDGTLGSWSTTTSFPIQIAGACAVQEGGTIYVIGGWDNTSTSQNSVYYASVNSNGTLGSWSLASNVLPGNRVSFGCTSFNGHIYITGCGTACTSVYYSPDLSAGGDITSAWSSFTTGFTTGRNYPLTVVSGGYLYILGGSTSGGSLFNDVQYIQLDPTTGNSSGSWSYTTTLPLVFRAGCAYAANGYITLAGVTNLAGLYSPLSAPVNSTGTLGDWSTGSPVNQMNVNRYYQSCAYYNGYMYQIGGLNISTNNIISSNQIEVAGLQMQAMTAQFSKYADLNGDGNPQKLVVYLTNAVLNGVDIEKWKMSYVSSRQAAASWGQTTTISPLINQNAYNVSALDSTGTDVVVARWFYLSFSIDMTTSFTFTDDTQPTITQYGLHYSPPPSKRLIHGQDFRDQTHQGLDLKL